MCHPGIGTRNGALVRNVNLLIPLQLVILIIDTFSIVVSWIKTFFFFFFFFGTTTFLISLKY